MRNEENLINFTELTEEEQRRLARKGGKASVKARRERKQMRETLEILLNMPLKGGKEADVESIRNFAAIKGKNISVQDALLLSMIQRALKGNVRAAEYVRDTIGENPIQQVEADVRNIVPVIGGDDLLED